MTPGISRTAETFLAATACLTFSPVSHFRTRCPVRFRFSPLCYTRRCLTERLGAVSLGKGTAMTVAPIADAPRCGIWVFVVWTFPGPTAAAHTRRPSIVRRLPAFPRRVLALRDSEAAGAAIVKKINLHAIIYFLCCEMEGPVPWRCITPACWADLYPTLLSLQWMLFHWFGIY